MSKYSPFCIGLSVALSVCSACDHQPKVSSARPAPGPLVADAVVVDVNSPSAVGTIPTTINDTQRSVAPSGTAATFTVMSWNLEWFYDDDSADNYSKLAKEQSAPSRAQWDWKRDAVAASLAQAQPSVVAFQEIEGRRVLWYLGRALARNHDLAYHEICQEGDDVFTEQDVGFLYRSGDDVKKSTPQLITIEPVLVSTFGRSAAMRKDESLAEVSKHLAVEYELSLGNQSEKITIVTLHLRAKEEAIEIRTKQARTVHAWVADKVRAGENVIVLGDFNTEESVCPAVKGSDMYAACGFDTPDTTDDLIDLHDHLPVKQRQTHLLAGKSFDRILVSPSLLIDDPNQIDLSLTKLEQLQNLSVQGTVDVPEEHWEKYWQLDDTDRDLSDHWPVMATFEFK